MSFGIKNWSNKPVLKELRFSVYLYVMHQKVMILIFQTIYIILTGENWNEIMIQVINLNQSYFQVSMFFIFMMIRSRTRNSQSPKVKLSKQKKRMA